MAKSMKFSLEIQGSLGGNLQGQLRGIQSQMNALKASSQFATAFGGNLSAAMRYANNAADAAKVAAQMNYTPNPKLVSDLQKLQSQQAQIQQYKDSLRNQAKLQQNFQRQVTQQSQAAAAKRAAAEKVSDLKIQLQQFEAARAGLKRTSQEYKALQQQIKATKQEIKDANDALKSADSVFKSQRQATTAAGQDLSRQISQLRQMQGALSSAGVGLNALGAAESHLRSQINSTTAALERQAQAAARRANFSASVDNFGEKYGNFQNSIQTAETIMNPFTSATQMAMDYEYQLSAIKAKTQFEDIRAGNFEKVDAEMAMLDKTFKRLGATTEYTMTEIASGADKFAMSGWSADQINKVMPSAVNIGTITKTAGQDFERLMDLFTDDFTAMGFKVGQQIQLNNGGGAVAAEKYFENIYGYALNKSNLDSVSLHNAVKYYAPVTSALGLRASESIATMMFSASSGQKGSQFGNAFKTGLIRMVAPTKMTEEALAEMGTNMSDAMKDYAQTQMFLKEAMPEIDTHNFLDMLQGIKNYMDTLDDGDKVGWLSAVVGKNAAPVWTKIFADPHGVEEIIKNARFMESMGINNYTSDVSETYRESAKIQWEMLKSSWDANIQQIGAALLPSVIQISQSLAPILTQFAEWLGQNQELVVLLAEVAAAISAIIVGAAGIQLISAAWGMVTASATLASGAISTAVTFLRGLSFASVASSISAMGSAFMAAARGAMAFVFTPVGAVAAAVALAAYLIYQNWDKLAPMFQRVADVLKTAFSGAVEFVSGLWDGLIEKIARLKEFFHFDFGGDNPARNAFDFSKNIPTYQSASLGNVQPVQSQIATVQPVQNQIATVQPVQSQVATVQTLDLTQIQNQIDNFGNSLQNQTYNFENFNTSLQSQSANLTSSMGEVLNTASSTVAQVEGVNASIIENAAAVNQSALEISNQAAQVNQNTAEVLNNSATLTQNTAEVTNQTAAIQTAVTSIQNMTATADSSVTSIQNMAVSADSSTSSISNLSSSATSAAASLSGLGSAVSSAISSIQIAGANAAASIPTANIANNYSGGIHTGGAFLSWINEKGPEAIIPLDGSNRAMQLWQATGKILGVENNFAGNIFNSSGNAIKIPTGTSWNPTLPNPLPQIELPQIDIFSQIQGIFSNVTAPIQNIFSQIGNVTTQIFQPFQDIFNKINSQIGNVTAQIFQPFQDIQNKISSIFQGGGIFNGGVWEQILNPVPTFPEVGTFPTLETPATAMNQQSSSPTFNFTVTINANSAEDGQKIWDDFQTQFENYVSEQQRRGFYW